MRIISVEGYKAFHGDMLITAQNTAFNSFYISDKDWLYKPDTNCWYGAGRSFPADICTPIEEDKRD
jgi:hypothetical protein